MKYYFTILMALLATTAFSQEKIWYKGQNQIVNTKAEADWYRTVTLDKASGITTEMNYSMDDKVKRIVQYSDYENKILDGKETYYAPNGTLAYINNYKNNKREGQRLLYSKGVLAQEETYANDVRLSAKCFDEKGNEKECVVTETRPEYPGGVKALYEYIGKNFKRKGTGSGKILVIFTVEKDGSIVEAKILRGINESLDNEALRIINNMEKWTPGMQNGKFVRAQYQLPITLK